MILKITALISILFFLSTKVVGQNNTDDKSFIGSWLELENGKFTRVDSLMDNIKGFQITSTEELIRRTNCRDGKARTFKGSWWSFNIGHFDIQYENEIDGIQIVERFEYAENKNVIIRVGYEEYPLKQNSVFVGKWILTSKDPTSTIYEKCEDIGSAKFAFHLLENGSGTIYKTNSKNERVEIKITWWLGEEDDYIDMQFFNSITNFINIEGFTIMPETSPITIHQTRFDEFGE